MRSCCKQFSDGEPALASYIDHVITLFAVSEKPDPFSVAAALFVIKRQQEHDNMNVPKYAYEHILSRE